MKQPDPRMHLYISLGKSAIRIGAGFALISGMLVTAGILIILAEIGGIVEELV